MRCAHVLLTASVALGMAACSQESPSMSQRVSNVTANSSVAQDTNATTSMSDFERSVSQKPVPVVVEGSAFGLDEAALERQIAEDMKGGYWSHRANFIPASQARTMPGEPDYLVVMKLSPSGTSQLSQQVTGEQLCADQYRTASAASTSSSVNTNASAAPNPARGSTNPAMRNDSADTARLAQDNSEARYRNYNLPTDTGSSQRADAAAAVARQNQVNEANASSTVSRGSTNPAMREDSADTENRPAAIGPEDRLRKPEAGTASSTTMTGSAMGSSGTAAASPDRSTAATSSSRSAGAGRGDVHLVSALCRYDQAMRTVNTRASNISGPNDQAFHNMIVNATNQLTQPTPVPSDRPAEPGQER